MNTNNVYKSQTPGQFPIVAQQLFNDNASLSATEKESELRKTCITAVECGFNLALQGVTSSSITPLLKGMTGTGMKMILGNAQLTEDAHWESFVEGYKTFPSLAGWSLARLPQFNQIPTLRDCYNRILAKDPDHFIYMQIIEGLSTAYTGNCNTYLDYLRYLQGNSYYVKDSEGKIDLILQDEKTSGIKPMIWSNDYNPVSYNTADAKTIYYASFYKTLRNMRQISLESGHPFWAFCQCEKVQNSSGYRQGTPASMRLQCYSALAYGAQGLIFSSYQQKNSTNISESPINMSGEKTDMWYTVRSLISEIRSFTHIFLGGQPVDIRNSGELGIAEFNYGTGDAFGPCYSIASGNKSKGILYVLYKNKNRNYLIIVNHDIDSAQEVTLEFSNLWKITEETPLTIFTANQSTQSTNNGLTVKRTLTPGGWLIFRYE